MITFEHPLYLQFGWLIPALVTWYVAIHRGHSKAMGKLGHEVMVKKLIVGYSIFLPYLKFVLLMLSLASLIVALANPKVTIQKQTVAPASQTSVIFALDVSKSMLAADVAPNRLELAKSIITKIISNLQGEQVGVVIFAGNANTYVPLTADYKTVNDAIKYIANNSIARQGTSLGEALKTSSLLLNSKDIKVKVMCILSDGENLSKAFTGPADSIRKAGINLFTMGTGTTQGANITEQDNDGVAKIKKDRNGAPVISRLHPENLMKISGDDTSRYQTITNSNESAVNFIKRLQKIQAGTLQKTSIQKEYFQLFLLIALGLLATEMLVPQGYRKLNHT